MLVIFTSYNLTSQKCILEPQEALFLFNKAKQQGRDTPLHDD